MGGKWSKHSALGGPP
uniref:Nef protein n=1 Tax=Human immunodeficiency virus type 1 TaxID=11676 RepID=H6CZ82_HV1|nr:nef protein [Human immunodeficiency virus 1]